jgi:hypothetical protein
MIPLVEPTALYEPLAVGLAWLGAAAVAGMIVVVGLVAKTSQRPSRPRAVVLPLSRRLPKAA